jgi:predicted GH43/DUF377 family glycosyl hydrolase
VRPIASLRLSGSRAELSFVIGDEVVQRFELPEGGRQVWALVMRPDGTAEAIRDGGAVARSPVASLGPARVVVYGRNRNPMASSPLGARITNLSVSASLCDMPTAWSARGELSLRGTAGSFDVDDAEGPSVAYDDEETLFLAYASDGEIFVGRRSGVSPTEVEVANGPDVPALRPTHDFEMGGLSDPELVWNDGAWVLFYTATDASGRRRIGQATSDDGVTFTAIGTPVLEPDGTVEELESPTVVIHFSGTWLMIARATDDAGRTFLAPFHSGNQGLDWNKIPADSLDAVMGATGRFDADEVASPSLIEHNGAWQLYYAGRRGTRWSIGLVLSDDLLYWRRANDGRPVLSRSSNGFDRLGVTGPDAHARDSIDEVELFYVGTDGLRDRPGSTRREATDQGTF